MRPVVFVKETELTFSLTVRRAMWDVWVCAICAEDELRSVLWDVGSYVVDYPWKGGDSDSEDEKRKRRRRVVSGEEGSDDP